MDVWMTEDASAVQQVLNASLWQFIGFEEYSVGLGDNTFKKKSWSCSFELLFWWYGGIVIWRVFCLM